MSYKTTCLYLCLLMLAMVACRNNGSTPEQVTFDTLSELDKRNPDNALRSMHVPDALELSLFAAEPMVTNPTNMAIDAKGRIWVCEGRNYRLFANPDNAYDDKGDRILILEDTNGDGKADSTKVFYQGEDINSALGIVVLGDKIIISVSPNVFVFTDSDHDDVPDTKEVFFSGIEGVDHDHGVHAFVFGPDGRLYFNYGNNGRQLLDNAGKPVIDKYGDEVKADGSKYREGMAFRMERDGSDVEVLGHNFRNPFELAVDSYGALWQSDNDDDGNRGTRINFLMEYGNYGFKDKLTGSDWRERRPGWSEEVPKRHWHLNDPGTVPNMLQTGSGSPTGILVYEDRLLPERYRGQLIHCEPGHQVVRAYMVEDKEAGYSATIENLVLSDDDWFRPSDVAVAPDGSIFISDWYDGGVGGHKAEDISQGRIYHLTTKTKVTQPKYDLGTDEGAANGLLSDNMDVFYQSWTHLHDLGEAAVPFLENLIRQGGTPKARALWLGALIQGKSEKYIREALSDTDPKFRMQGLRMARYRDAGNLEHYIALVVNDSSPQVRREAAIALKHLGTPDAANLWAALAKQYQEGERWQLEALGIGADRYPDLYFNTWLKSIGDNWQNPAGKEIVWRVEAKSSVSLLFDMINDAQVSPEKLPAYFRSLSFKDHPQKNEWLLATLSRKHPLQQQIQALAIGQLDADFVNRSARNRKVVKDILPKIEGTPEWIFAIKNLNLRDQNPALARVVVSNTSDAEVRNEALDLLVESGGLSLVRSQFQSDMPETDKMDLLGLLGNVNHPDVVDFLVQSLAAEYLDRPLKRKAVEALGNTWTGRHRLFDLLKENKLDPSYKTTAVLKLMNSWDAEIRKNAPKYLDGNGTDNLNVDSLIVKKGNAAHGKEVYTIYCSSCHMAEDVGVEFGPALSDIGAKLSKNFLYSNIINPSAGISFGYEGFAVDTKDGKTFMGYILNRTEDVVTLNMMGGIQKTFQLSDVAQIKALDQSLMTEGLHKIMKEEELVDLVEYLAGLKVGV